jgi:hypothetical protein
MKNLFPAFFALLFASVAIFSASSCKKDKDEDPQPACVAGPGGQVELALYVRHHDSLIPGASVYIKYNATEFPGADTTVYDISLVTGTTDHGLGHTHIAGMNCGRYYIYSAGYDSTISDSVYGGIPVNVTQTTGSITINIPVTE